MPNKRKRMRVKTGIEALISGGCLEKYPVKLRNLSLKGALCDPEPRLCSLGACTFALKLSEEAGCVICANIVRNDERGLAVDFESMDESSFFHLRNIVRYHADDPDAVDRELSTPAFAPLT